jgi:hypothetical protein
MRLASATLALISALGMAGHLQAEAHVLLDRHMRVERVGLEHHRHAALGRVDPGDIAPADGDAALGGLLQPRDHAQKRGLAAARGADERRRTRRPRCPDRRRGSPDVAVALDDVVQVSLPTWPLSLPSRVIPPPASGKAPGPAHPPRWLPAARADARASASRPSASSDRSSMVTDSAPSTRPRRQDRHGDADDARLVFLAVIGVAAGADRGQFARRASAVVIVTR